MGQHRGTTWRGSTRERLRGGGVVVGATLSLALLAGPALAAPRGDQGALEQVIVRGFDGREAALEQAVARVGGTVAAHLPLIDALVAQVPAGRLGGLRTAPGVLGVTPDASVEFLNDNNQDGIDDAWAQEGGPLHYQAPDDHGSLFTINNSIGADSAWSNGFRGQGVGVALIDSGVSPVVGLGQPDKVVNGADLSFDSQSDNLAHLDGYGHGTHMAGIIAGRDPATPRGSETDYKYFVGVAPDAHIVNKVGAADGAVDVSQVIAGIDWVVEHRNDPGMNIRVLNLSFGTDGVQGYQLDPLSYAVEVAWRRGIVVVVSAGNSGLGTPQLNNPALNPFVIAVGAADTHGTGGTGDDTVPAFSARGDATRRVDLVAPGQSVVSLRSPGSQVDTEFPDARVAGRFFRGSGTSQAAAVVSGAAAVLLSQRPSLTPDQLKALLKRTAAPMPAADAAGRGAGLIDLKRASRTRIGDGVQSFAFGTGTGSLQAARGTTATPSQAGVDLVGEFDIFGTPWNGTTWAVNAAAGNSWVDGTWNGHELTGSGWTGTSFASRTWQRVSWREASWARASWRNDAWLRASWRSDGWYTDATPGGGFNANGWLRASWRNQGWAVSS